MIVSIQTRWVALVLLCAFYLMGCNAAGENNSRTVIEKNAQHLNHEVELFLNLAQKNLTDPVPDAVFQSQIISARLAYKKLEFLLAFYYPEHVSAYINGAPLPRLDPYPYEEIPLLASYYNDPTYIPLTPLDYQKPNGQVKPREVVMPEGLQVLDELLFTESVQDNSQRIHQLAEALSKRTRIMLQALERRRFIEDWQLLEAARLELVRIFTLGITGFDTPGSGNGLPESEAALKGMVLVLQPLLNSLPNDNKKHLSKLFAESIDYIHGHSDFDRFDRLYFLINYVDPLYRKLLKAHTYFKFPTSDQLSRQTPSWNFFSTSIFSEDFLNPYYFSLLTQEKDSGELRGLGKKLFFETNLSHNNNMSCASCHNPELGFSDALPTSRSNVNNVFVLRNAPGLVNAVFSDRYFYDLRAFDLEDQIEHVIDNPMEFNSSFDELAEKLSTDKNYQDLFSAAFGKDQTINRYQISAALASYLISLRSFNSPFDQYVRGERKNLSAEAKAGFNLFMGKAQCGTCHFPPTFSGLVPPLYRENESEVIGVFSAPDIKEVDRDQGRFVNAVYQEDIDIFRQAFKTVSVRNVELTAPYFHNGAYSTLDEVIDFYDQGGAQGIGLAYDLPHQTLSAEPLDLTDQEKTAIKAFMLSLTDLGVTNGVTTNVQP